MCLIYIFVRTFYKSMDNTKLDNKEIDLLELLKRFFGFIGRAISFVFNFFLRVASYGLIFLFKNWIPILVIVLLGMGYGFYNFYSGNKLVVSDMVIRNNEVANEDLITIINELSIYAEQENIQALSDKTGLDTVSAAEVKFIDAYWFIDNDYDGVADYIDTKKEFNQLEDTTLRRIKDELNIRVKVTDPAILPKVQEGVISFFNNNNLLKKLNVNRLARLNNLFEKTSVEVEELDSLQGYEYFVKDKKAQLDLGNLGSLRLEGQEKDTRLLHEEVLGLQEQLMNYERELQVYNEIVTVLRGFTITVRPEKSLASCVIYTGFLFGFFAYIILFLLSHRKKIMVFLEERSK